MSIRRKIATIAGVLVMAAGLVTAGTATASAQSPLFGRWYVLHPLKSDGTPDFGKCLSAEGGSAANGTRIIVWDCNGAKDQLWTEGSTNYTYPSIESAVGTNGGSYTPKCIDLPGSSTAVPTGLVIWDCNSGKNQDWTMEAGDGLIHNRIMDRAMDLPWGSHANGTQATAYYDNDSWNQRYSASY